MRKKNNILIIIVIINFLATLLVWISLLMNKILWDNLLKFLIAIFVFNSISLITVLLNKKNIDSNWFRFFILLSILLYCFQFFYLKMYFDLNVRD
ncbi:hypothetical protein D0817_24785 [Flavobacterium cupreum]|uniref:Uncharacterized protein n=2 Tax=Flavobacterium TaxID=237 RepID=A0A4Y7U6K6_9FLAO|nr:hypothetical protein D0817_24785 [Flavobacterium cupreum]TCN49907.1 hypothetical protein EV142_1192 [Flavobacterium circumlabens]TEB41708.1 hypothetical protein D0809_24140 [Flavobacterium circumlabens]